MHFLFFCKKNLFYYFILPYIYLHHNVNGTDDGRGRQCHRHERKVLLVHELNNYAAAGAKSFTKITNSNY